MAETIPQKENKVEALPDTQDRIWVGDRVRERFGYSSGDGCDYGVHTGRHHFSNLLVEDSR